MTLCAIVGLVGTALGIAVLPLPALGVVLGVVAGSIPPVFLGRSIDRRRRMFQEQLPDLLAVLATSLRAGHSFLQGLDAVTREADEPAASEFIRIVTEIRLGRPGDETLLATADRMGSDDFRWAVMAINIQRQVGGNLAEILDTVAATVRERELVRRQVRVLSAEGRLSVAILVAMPFVIAAYLFAINPGYLSELIHTGIGVVLLGTAGFLMLVGLFWMRKIVRIDV
jgi:tight adherence protein B